MDNYATDWMILKTTTDQAADSPELHRYYGSKEEVRQLLVNMVKWFREANPDGYSRGTENAEEVDLHGLHELQSFAEYDESYKVTFTAKKFSPICHILDDGTIC